MRGEAKRVLAFMDGEERHFIIPAYQRRYAWELTDCDRLFGDVKRTAAARGNGAAATHFIGSIVNSDVNKEQRIIDGQQRLTTVSLLLLAMRNLLLRGQLQSADEWLADRINGYLWLKNRRMPKLQPYGKDGDDYQRLFDDTGEFDAQGKFDMPKGSRMAKNYVRFKRLILSSCLPEDGRNAECSADGLYDAIDSLTCVDITLDSRDDAQLVFESLNTTGVSLKTGDEIRNFMLMGYTGEDAAKNQDSAYMSLWKPLEDSCGGEVSAFVRDFLATKCGSVVNERDVYGRFKKYAEGKDGSVDRRRLFDELGGDAELYAVLLGRAACGIGSTDERIMRLNYLGTTVSYPFLLAVLQRHRAGQLTDGQVDAVFAIVEAFVGRRIICSVSASGLNKLFAALDRQVMPEAYAEGCANADSSDYVERLESVLAAKTGALRFPDDKEFRSHLLESPSYRDMGADKLKYVLERLNAYAPTAGGASESSENPDVYGNKRCTIEHIMPQHIGGDAWGRQWQAMLGSDWRRIHEEWVHRLANLTLTNYNGRYSDRPFAEKKTMDNGFDMSGYRLNRYVSAGSEWTEERMRERGEMLADMALAIWPYPDVAPAAAAGEDGFAVVSLEDEEFPWSGAIVAGYEFLGARHGGGSWATVWADALNAAIDKDETAMLELADSEEDSDGVSLSWISTEEDGFGNDRHASPVRLHGGLFGNKHSNTAAKVGQLRQVLEALGVDSSALVLHVARRE